MPHVVITMHVIKNIGMEKVSVNFGRSYLDNKNMVVLLGKFIIVASPNIKNVINNVTTLALGSRPKQRACKGVS
jgi:hypothetical protein